VVLPLVCPNDSMPTLVARPRAWINAITEKPVQAILTLPDLPNANDTLKTGTIARGTTKRVSAAERRLRMAMAAEMASGTHPSPAMPHRREASRLPRPMRLAMPARAAREARGVATGTARRPSRARGLGTLILSHRRERSVRPKIGDRGSRSRVLMSRLRDREPGVLKRVCRLLSDCPSSQFEN
jgi:hypothetical protein